MMNIRYITKSGYGSMFHFVIPSMEVEENISFSDYVLNLQQNYSKTLMNKIINAMEHKQNVFIDIDDKSVFDNKHYTVEVDHDTLEVIDADKNACSQWD